MSKNLITNGDYNINVNGTLIAAGTEQDSIYFLRFLVIGGCSRLERRNLFSFCYCFLSCFLGSTKQFLHFMTVAFLVFQAE